MLQLASGVRLEGDEELVFRAVDLGQASGDGLYAADLTEAVDLPEDRVRAALERLVGQDVLQPVGADDQLGPRYVVGRAFGPG